MQDYLVNNLKLGSKVSPTQRVWIPKPGTEEKRPLGIPTMKDRAMPRARQDGTLSLNGKRDLNPTVMDSEPEGHVMMQLKQYSTRLGIKPNTC